MNLYANSARCSGCRACQVACSLHLLGENNPKRSALAVIPHFPVDPNLVAMALVNGTQQPKTAVLHDGDVVELIPFVRGG